MSRYKGVKKSWNSLVEANRRAIRRRGKGSRSGNPGAGNTSASRDARAVDARIKQKEVAEVVKQGVDPATISSTPVVDLATRNRAIKAAVSLGDAARRLSWYVSRGFPLDPCFEPADDFGALEGLLDAARQKLDGVSRETEVGTRLRSSGTAKYKDG